MIASYGDNGGGRVGATTAQASPFDEAQRLLHGSERSGSRTAARRTADCGSFAEMDDREDLRMLALMASGAAHDLNHSLAMIVGHCELALAALTQPDVVLSDVRSTLELIAQVAMNGGEIVEELLTAGHARSWSPPEPISIDFLLTQVSQLTAPRWREAAQAEGRVITLDVDAVSDAVVRGWPASLREAFVNLVFNAIDALPHGGTIHLRAHRRRDGVVVDVTDSGTGIPVALQSQIFRPFFTTKGEHGCGLGLPQVLRTVNLHRGYLTLDSQVGHGTTFSVWLPVVAPDAEPVVTARRVADQVTHEDRS